MIIIAARNRSALPLCTYEYDGAVVFEHETGAFLQRSLLGLARGPKEL